MHSAKQREKNMSRVTMGEDGCMDNGQLSKTVEEACGGECCMPCNIHGSILGKQDWFIPGMLLLNVF